MIFDIPVRLSGKIPTPGFKRSRFVIRVKTLESIVSKTV